MMCSAIDDSLVEANRAARAAATARLPVKKQTQVLSESRTSPLQTLQTYLPSHSTSSSKANVHGCVLSKRTRLDLQPWKPSQSGGALVVASLLTIHTPSAHHVALTSRLKLESTSPIRQGKLGAPSATLLHPPSAYSMAQCASVILQCSRCAAVSWA